MASYSKYSCILYQIKEKFQYKTSLQVENK